MIFHCMAISRSIAELPDHPLVQHALRGTKPLEELVGSCASDWEANLGRRTPALAYLGEEDGAPIYSGGTLDLFTVLMALAANGQLISVGSYDSMRLPSRSNGTVVEPGNRHGQVIRVVSNREVHSFNALVQDYAVEVLKADGTRERGAPRNFAAVDVYGRLRPGWSNVSTEFEEGTLSFTPTEEQAAFFASRGLQGLPATITFSHFVTPQLSKGFFGSRYLVAKALAECVDREREQLSKLEQQARRWRPYAPLPAKQMQPAGESESPSVSAKKVVVPSIDAKLLMDGWHASRLLYAMSPKGEVRPIERLASDAPKEDIDDFLRYASQRTDFLSYVLGPTVRAPVRAVELAFFLSGGSPESAELAGWKVPKPTSGYRERRGRIDWHALDYGWGKLLWRQRETTTTIRE